MALDLNNLKDVGIYVFNSKINGDIELNFGIKEPGSYKLVISKEDIDRMKKDSDFVVKAAQAGFLKE